MQTYDDKLAQEELYRLLEQCTQDEIDFLTERLISGDVDGKVYSSWNYEVGRCGCVYGTIGIRRFDDDWQLSEKIESTFGVELGHDIDDEYGNPIRLANDLEECAFQIDMGDTSDDNEHSAKILAWINEFKHA